MSPLTSDVIVVGLGGMGSAAAYHLARRGARVLGIEQFGVAHERGSSHGKSRIIRQAYHEGPEYVPLLFRAYELWEALAHDAGRRLLTITGGLYVGRPDARAVAGAEASARIHGIAFEKLTAAEGMARYPVLRLSDGQVAVYEHKAGMLIPEDCVAGHIEMARSAGAELRFDEAVESWQAGPHGVSVRTGRGTYDAGHLVLTAGPWARWLLSDLALPLQVERVVLYWFEPSGRLESFRKLPIYLWDDGSVRAYGFPYVDRQGLKCSFSRIFTEVTTPQAIRRDVGDDEIRRMREHLARFMPEAAGTLLSTATCMYTTTPDSHFIIDRHPAHDNVSIACGFSGHGFKFCSVVGEVLADLSLEGTTPHPIGPFAARRFARSRA
jgi:sarcosine oxidase